MRRRLAPAFPDISPVAIEEQARHLQLRGQFRLMPVRHFGFPISPVGEPAAGMVDDHRGYHHDRSCFDQALIGCARLTRCGQAVTRA